MHVFKKLTAVGASVFMAAAFALIPIAGRAAADTPATSVHPKMQVASAGNDAVDVVTELDCTSHSLTAEVTNKTDGSITPNVTFNNQPPSYPSGSPIDPGNTGYYFYNYSGNHLMITVKVGVDTYPPVTVSPTLNCSEPVTFTVTGASSSAVTGILTNNSSLVSQTVLTRVGDGDIRTESLAPGESRLIALPFNGTADQQFALVSIGTTTGYEGDYTVDLTQPLL